MAFGNHDPYFWIEDNDLYLADLLGIFPEIVEGKYVIVTSFDSGPLRLEEEERNQGWTDQGPLVYSPRIERANWVPQGEYDEWYVFHTATRIHPPEVFVNDTGFTLIDPSPLAKSLNPTWDKEMHIEWCNIVLEKQSRFWRQLETIKPESYIAEGDRLMLVTNNFELYERIQRNLQKRT